MVEYLNNILVDPLAVKIIIIVIGLIIINLLVRFLQHLISGRFYSKGTYYSIRRGLTFFVYMASIILVLVVFINQLGNITVAFGVAGAGITFALQEVIISIAGWIALSFGQFYTIGDRIQLGGIKGDVIDISVLRTTVMEIGEWVKGDQYNGRIVVLP
jgi:small-conductance mechanosensitive channel